MDSARTFAGSWRRLASGAVVGGLAAWLVLAHTDMQGVISILTGEFDVIAAGGAILAYSLFFLGKALRWRYLLRPLVDVALPRLIAYVLIGYAGNVALPFQAGEVARGYLLSRRHRASLAAVLSGIALEKFLDFLCLLLFLAWALWVLQTPSPLAEDVAAVLAGILSMTAAGLFIALSKPQATLKAVDWAVGSLPVRIGARLRALVHDGLSGLSALRQGSLFFKIVITSLISWGAMLAALHLAIEAVHVEASMAGTVIVLVLCAVGLALPTMPGFIGTLQAAFVLGMVPLGTAPEAAVAASLVYQALTTLLPLLVGALCWVAIESSGR